MQKLRISLARHLHKLPSEIDTMEWEDALLIVADAELEQERLQQQRPAGSGTGSRPGTETTVTKYVKSSPKTP